MSEAQPRSRVISVGGIPELLSLRHAILESNGYEVFTTANPVEAADRFRAGDCSLLLICYSVADEWRESLIRDFREHCPGGRIIGITNHQVTRAPDDVDVLVYGMEGPEILIDAIQGKAA